MSSKDKNTTNGKRHDFFGAISAYETGFEELNVTGNKNINVINDKILSEGKRVDLMLIVSPVNLLYKWMPLYYLYLAGFLEKHGFKVSIIEPHFTKGLNQLDDARNVEFILNEVKKQNPKFIGFASFVTDYKVVLDLAKKVRKISNATTLIGNAQPSISPGDYIYDGSPFDICVRGEGELTTKEILESKLDVDSLNKIEGISFFDKNKIGPDNKIGSVVINHNRGLIDMKELGMPAYHLIDMNWYTTPTKYVVKRLTASAATIYISRGCPYKCTFCASNMVWHSNSKTKGGGSFVRFRPMEMVIEDLRILQDKYDVDFFYIQDDTFGIHEPHIHEFCDAYKKSGLKMLWCAQTRTPCISKPEIVKKLRDSGCIQLDFGIESGSPRILKDLRKLITVEDAYKAFDLCRKGGMRTYANMMINMPGETEEDLALSHKLLERIKPTFLGFGVTQPYPGTALYNKVPKIDKDEYHLLDRMFPPEKWRLAAHKLDLKKTIDEYLIKYKIVTLFEKHFFSAGFDYWKKIFTSKHRYKYIYYILRSLLGPPVAYFRFRWENFRYATGGPKSDLRI